MPLPRGFEPVAQANQKTKLASMVSMIGIVMDSRPVGPTRGKDYVATVDICDQTAALDETKFRIRMFNAEDTRLPQKVELDNLIIIRNIRINEVHGEIMGVTTYSSSWVVAKYNIPPHKKKNFPRPQPTIQVVEAKYYKDRDEPKGGVFLSKEELEACKELAEFWVGRSGQAGARGIDPVSYAQQHAAVQTKQYEKFSLIKDVQLDRFYDFIGYVQDTWHENRCHTVYFTDFTAHEKIYPNGHDPFQVETPGDTTANETYDYAFNAGGVNRTGKVGKEWYNQKLARFTLAVVFWDSHVEKGRQIKAGNYILLKNIRIKMSRGEQWEGSLSDARNDKISKDGFQILNPDDSRLKKVKSRRQQLEEQLNKLKKQQLLEGAKKRAELQQQAEEEKRRRLSELNPLIRIDVNSLGFDSSEMETTTIGAISDIINGTEHSFFNRRYRTECKVTDFRPHHIEDFCQPLGDDLSACSLDLSLQRFENGKAIPPPEWYWCFELDVSAVATPDYLTLQVDDAAGRLLLGMEPCDLRAPENFIKRGELLNKLFCLWGNLEEIKRKRREQLGLLKNNCEKILLQLKDPGNEALIESLFIGYRAEILEITDTQLFMDKKVSNLPFACMVKEYGIEDLDEDGGEFQRMFVLESTVIGKKESKPADGEDEDQYDDPAMDVED